MNELPIFGNEGFQNRYRKVSFNYLERLGSCVRLFVTNRYENFMGRGCHDESIT